MGPAGTVLRLRSRPARSVDRLSSLPTRMNVPLPVLAVTIPRRLASRIALVIVAIVISSCSAISRCGGSLSPWRRTPAAISFSRTSTRARYFGFVEAAMLGRHVIACRTSPPASREAVGRTAL